MLDKDFKIPFYEVKADSKAIHIKLIFLKQYGSLQPTEKVEEDDFIIADLVQREKQLKVLISHLKNIEDKSIRDQFIGNIKLATQ